MTISITDSAWNFGDVYVGSDATVTLTFSNDGDSDQAITEPSGTAFTASPSGQDVPAGGTLTVTITFSPTGATSYSDSISAGGQSCSLSGAGISETSADDTTATGTHLLFNVPDFTNAKFETANDGESTEATMSSFLRLGSFDYDSEPTKAKQLLDLITQVTAASNPYGLTSAVSIVDGGTAGTVFVDDVRTRAPDASLIGAGTATYGTNDETLETSDDPGNKLTQQQRQDESSRLYSRGGWRDHSDGNRVTTTYGDKVEVIRGNYKMIVMGRQDDTDEAMGWEASGSHCQDYAPGTMPGASFWLEWVNDPRYYAPEFDENGDVVAGSTSRKGVWLLVNTTENVYEYARYAGNFREERWGDVIETYIGSENPPSDGAWAVDGTSGTEGHDVPYRIPGRNYDLPELNSDDLLCTTCTGTGKVVVTYVTREDDPITLQDEETSYSVKETCPDCSGSGYRVEGSSESVNDARATPQWSQDNVGMIRSNPHIIEKTWAERVDTYMGTESCRIPTIKEHVFAKDFDETIDTTNKFTTTFNANEFHETFNAAVLLKETRTAAQVETHTNGSVYEQFLGNFCELFAGASESFKFGAFIDMTIGAFETNLDMALVLFDTSICVKSMELNIAAVSTAVNIGPRLAVSTSEEVEVDLGVVKTMLHSGATMTVAAALFLG